jgi:hypothetical protein
MVTVDDWIVAVTRTPVSTPFTRFDEARPSTFASDVPASPLSPEVTPSMPCRNSASPPAKAIAIMATDPPPDPLRTSIAPLFGRRNRPFTCSTRP